MTIATMRKGRSISTSAWSCSRRPKPCRSEFTVAHFAMSGFIVATEVRISCRGRSYYATYEPLCVVPLRRAVLRVRAEKAIMVEEAGLIMHSEHAAVPVPSVVAVTFCLCSVPTEIPLTRRAVLDRDDHTCVYCSDRADTIDHVRRSSRGGAPCLDQVVAACARVQPPQGRPSPHRAWLGAERCSGPAASWWVWF